jgi:hypothetical protein
LRWTTVNIPTTAKNRRMTSTKWIGLVTIVALLILGSMYRDDHSKAASVMVASVAIYFGLLKIAPGGARFLLCMGCALVGAFLCGTAGLSLIGLFQDGWNVFGLMIWTAPILAAMGVIPGFWLVLRWTEPPET